MTTHAWILIGLATCLAIIVVQLLLQFRSSRTTLRRQMLWPFTAGAVTWVVFTLFFFDGMICFLSLAAIVGIYGPYLYWMLRHSNDTAAS